MKKNVNNIKCLVSLSDDVLEYIINGCIVRIEKESYGIRIFIVGYDKYGNCLHEDDFDEAWRQNNIYNQEYFHKFVNMITVKEFLKMEYTNKYDFGFFDMTTGKLYEKYDLYFEEEVEEIKDLNINTWVINNNTLTLCVES